MGNIRAIRYALILGTLLTFGVAFVPAQELAVLKGGGSAVRALAFSPDGKALATGGDGQIVIWGLPRGTKWTTITQGVGDVRAVAYAPRGKALVGVSSMLDVRITTYDPATAKLLADRSVFAFPKAEAPFAFVPKLLWVVVLTEHGTFSVWDIGGKPVVRTTQMLTPTREGLKEMKFRAVAAAPSGKHLILGEDSGQVYLVELLGNKMQPMANKHDRPVSAVAYSPLGKTVASASEDGRILLWNPATRKRLAALHGHDGPVRFLAFSPRGQLLASATSGNLKEPFAGELKLWEVATGKQQASVRFEERQKVYGLAFSPDGKILAVAHGEKGTVTLYDAAKLRQK